MQYQRKAFEQMLEGRGINLRSLLRLGFSSLLDPFRLMIQYMPGALGYGIRRQVYKTRFNSLGKNCILDVGLRIMGHENISVGEYTWIDAYSSIIALFGPVTIGKRIHVSPFCVVNAGEEGTVLADYSGLSTGCHVYGHTEAPLDGKRMSGPMIPWRYKAFRHGKVTVEKDAFIGAYSIIFPGVNIGEGAVIGAHTVVTKDIPPWSICVGAPAKIIGHRDKVSTPEL